MVHANTIPKSFSPKIIIVPFQIALRNFEYKREEASFICNYRSEALRSYYKDRFRKHLPITNEK